MEHVLIRAEILGKNAAGQKHISLLANNTDGIHFWTDDKSIVRSIEPQRKTGHKINQHQYPAKWICSECGAKHFDFSDKFCSKCGANVTDEVMQPEHKCDTCKYEKSLWFNRCADCSDYELWEAKE